ncbi:MAG: formylglycine-generating enzyme family protein [Ramlibacter sp.]
MKLLALLVAVAASASCLAAPDTAYVDVPGGTFASVLPQGPVPTVSSAVDIAPFAMRSTPVTVAEFAEFVRRHPEWQRGSAPALLADGRYLLQWTAPLEPGTALDSRAPVTEVSWFAASAFCEEEGGRMPTWLEWEYAAAADATRTDARRDPAWRRQILAWYERPGGMALPAVGGAANAFGVRDLHGLVWEWVDDYNALFIAGDSRTQGDPDLLKFCGAGAINIIDRDSYAVLMRIALLSSLNAADSTATLGFRCAKPLKVKA